MISPTVAEIPCSQISPNELSIRITVLQQKKKLHLHKKELIGDQH